MQIQTDYSFGFVNTEVDKEKSLVSSSLVKQLGSGQTRLAFSGNLHVIGPDCIEKELGKSIFAIKRDNTHDNNYYISVLKLTGEEITSKQINMFFTYEVNQIVGQIKWTESLIFSNVFKFSFDRQQVVILISIAMEESINQTQGKELHPLSVTQKIIRLEKELDISQLEQEKLSHMNKQQRLERLQRLLKLEKMQVLSRDDKLTIPCKDMTKKIKKSKSKKLSCNPSSKESKSIVESRIEDETPYKIINKSSPNNQVPDVPNQLEEPNRIQVAQSLKRSRKSTGQSKLVFEVSQQPLNEQQVILAPMEEESSQDKKEQLEILAQCRDNNQRIAYENLENYKNLRIFYQGRHLNKLYTFIEDTMIVKNVGKNNTFVKKSTLINLFDAKKKPIKTGKAICFSFDEKIMILAITGKLYVADAQKGKISYEINLGQQVVFDFCLNKALNQKQGYDTFLAVTHNNTYYVDPWKKQVKLLTTNAKRPSMSYFTCITSLPNGNYAVGFENGIVEIISHSTNQPLVIFNERKTPILFIESSNDGMFLLITDEQNILLFPANKKKFTEVYNKKPTIKSLCLKSSFVSQDNKKISYDTIAAKFNQVSIGKQEYIVWSYANLVLVWSLENILNDVFEHKIIEASHVVTHVQFKYNDPSKIFVGTINDLLIHSLSQNT